MLREDSSIFSGVTEKVPDVINTSGIANNEKSRKMAKGTINQEKSRICSI